MDIAVIGSLLGSIKTATDIAKLIKESDVSIEKAETKLKLAELISSLADAKLEAADVQLGILERDERIRELEAAAKVRANLRWEEPCYWLPNAAGVEEPYCQHCQDSSSKLIRLLGDGDGQYQCRVCNNAYLTRDRANNNSAAFKQRRSMVSRGIA